MTISLQASHTVDIDYHELCGALAARNMQPLWKMERALVPDVPLPTAVPWLWKWDTILPLAKRAGEVVTIERGGDRRVLALANPGLDGLPFTSSTLWGAVQYLGGGESAPAHRHTPAAIRFVMSGSGAITTVNGQECEMEPGDLVLTPNWHWHEHHNHGAEPVVWFDGLDLPLATQLDAIFFENHPDEYQESRGADLSPVAHPAAGLEARSAASPLIRYAWKDTDRGLAAILAADPTAPEATLRYTNPRTGNSVVPTLDCEMRRLRGGARTPGKRETGSRIFVVLRGAGTTIVDGMAFGWTAGDVFVTPSWAAVEHESAEESDLFVLSDRPVLETLGLYRESPLSAPQSIDSSFQPFVDEGGLG